jgi:hypothetical protein
MLTETIERDFHDKVCQQVRLVPEGVDRFRVFTPFMTNDGDHLAIVLKRHGPQWILTDEGHTYMQLTYDMDESVFQAGARSEIITNALAAFSVEDRDGEIVIPVPDSRYGDSLYSFVQAILRINDIRYLSRERARSTFMEDFRMFMQEIMPQRIAFDWHDPVRDAEGIYPVDCRINGMSTPIYAYGVTGDSKAKDVTIALMQFERWQIPFRSLAIYENQEEVGRKAVAWLSDVAGKQFSNLPANKGRIKSYLDAMITS